MARFTKKTRQVFSKRTRQDLSPESLGYKAKLYVFNWEEKGRDGRTWRVGISSKGNYIWKVSEEYEIDDAACILNSLRSSFKF